ncbi:acyl-CoA dehydrogenase family protein [Variovorax sp. J22R133]|uniref:acyl-CoA dehydrogenase family protein n=1 Tax=Variovorax brevis TaxID=3053503 RepID=UPI00257799EA|nr:acyl-CoA dehydrogenase family protein [Variovorax sp. J22R133]MDM0116254.1 acyl-CoA dehydrogenase family protein [Variovorax sp. J22R133]
MFDLTAEQNAIRDGVAAVCRRFGDEYWSTCDRDERFPSEFHRAMAEDGWLGLTMPEQFGGAGLGVTEAAIMMHTVASHGAMTAASSIHINMFGPHPVVVHGTPEQQSQWLPRLVSGEDQVCFGVTEPDAGLDTTSIKTFAKKVEGGYRVTGRKMWTTTAQVANKILLLARTTAKDADKKKATEGITLFYTDLDRTKVEVRRIPKHGRAAVDSNAVFLDDIFIPEEHRIGDEGKGFRYLLDGLNPERILVAVEAIGIGEDALNRASQYARDRVVFNRPIGMNQAIQHPLAECWMALEAALLMAARAAHLYDSKQPCGAEANSAKFLGARAGHQAALQAVMTHGGMGYAKEYHVERLLREVLLTRLAPVSEQMILCFIAERVLNLPKSY